MQLTYRSVIIAYSTVDLHRDDVCQTTGALGQLVTLKLSSKVPEERGYSGVNGIAFHRRVSGMR